MRLNGGLGNQMFQFAAGLALALRENTDLCLDAADLTGNTGCTYRQFGLDVFNLVPYIRSDRKVSIYQKLIDMYSVKFGRLRRERSASFDSDFLKFGSGSIIEGYWQSPRYFENISEQLRMALSWKAALDPMNCELAKRIQLGNFASVHFRRGDYVSNPNAAAVHGGVCDEDYYTSALAYLKQMNSDMRFVVFSDDPKWVKESRDDLSDAIFVTGNDGDNAHLDMRLMSLCRHHVIANSTFSWWGAWLGKQKNVTIAPKKWFNTMENSDLILKEWIKL